MHWSGFFCVPNGPICPPFMFWNGNQCVPFVQPPCPPGSIGTEPNAFPTSPSVRRTCTGTASPAFPTCSRFVRPVSIGTTPPRSACRTLFRRKFARRNSIGTRARKSACRIRCRRRETCPVARLQHWDAGANKCVPNVLPPPKLCPPKQHWDAGLNKCVPNVLPPPKLCPPKQHWDAGLNKCTDPPLPPPKLVRPSSIGTPA